MKNAFYGQSGGVTSVINATAQGVIDAARGSDQIGKVYAGRNGILGLLKEELIDTSSFNDSILKKIGHTPGGIFGSCRFKLPDFLENKTYYKRMIEVMSAYDIGYFFYNGGGDSQDTAQKVSMASQALNYSIRCIGIPKTIDNDLPKTHYSPGFASVARYVAISTLEASLDVYSMSASSTKVFVMEVMGRHAGWIAAASGFIFSEESRPPHIILFPERVFDEKKYLARVDEVVSRYGFCVVVASEGIRDKAGCFFGGSDQIDAFGHRQLGGVAPKLANLIQDCLGFKTHWAVPDYLQRSAKHCASDFDYRHAYALGRRAVELSLEGASDIVPIVVKRGNDWMIEYAGLSDVANCEKKLPDHYISECGFRITHACRSYLADFFQGSDQLPKYVWPDFNLTQKICSSFDF